VNRRRLRYGAIALLTIALIGCKSPARKPIAESPIVKGGGEPFPSATPQRVVAVTKKIFPAVVRLDVAQETYSQGKRTLQRDIGSGVIIDEQGHVLTNYHVAGRAAEIYVTLENKERVPAKLIGDDHWTDLAILQMDMETIKKKNIPFRYAELGTSKTLVPGQDVMAIGTPFGLARTMTLGVVSNNERTFYPEHMTIDEYETGDFANWIQMDTPINPGNSGGPLVDLTGKVVGINTRGGGQNLNFAVPIDTARPVIEKLLAAAKPDSIAHVDRSDLGIELKPLQDLETYFDIDINKGVLIDSVDPLSPAEKAGVRTQDILLKINDHPTNVRFPEEVAPVRKMIANLPIGSDVMLTLKRGKETIELPAKTVKLQSAVGEEKELKEWGTSVRDVTRKYANEMRLDSDEGVVVTTLNPGYAGEKGDLRAGDVILSVDGKPATDLDEFMQLYKQTITDRRPRIILGIQRGRGRRTMVLKMTYAGTTPATTEATTRPNTNDEARKANE
jgi:serine protease Do